MDSRGRWDQDLLNILIQGNLQQTYPHHHPLRLTEEQLTLWKKENEKKPRQKFPSKNERRKRAL